MMRFAQKLVERGHNAADITILSGYQAQVATAYKSAFNTPTPETPAVSRPRYQDRRAGKKTSVVVEMRSRMTWHGEIRALAPDTFEKSWQGHTNVPDQDWQWNTRSVSAAELTGQLHSRCEGFQDKIFYLQSLHSSVYQTGTALILPEPPKAQEEPSENGEGEQAWEALPLQPHTTQFHVAMIRYMAELMICEDFPPNLAEAFDATTQDLAEARRMIYKDADGILDLHRVPGGPWYHKDIGGSPGLDLHER
ncbi:MAG: hypothetical protein Q9183_005821 [Haloplaca sp. 2 TL-2023]